MEEWPQTAVGQLSEHCQDCLMLTAQSLCVVCGCDR